MTRFSIAAACILMATSASAETSLERFEALSADMNTSMLNLMVNEVENAGGDATALRELDGMMPPWDDVMRAAATCMLDSYTTDIGPDGVTAMMDKMEATLPQLESMTMTEASDSGVLESMSPEGVSLERTMEISRSCGMLEWQQEAGAASGFMAAMMAASATIPE